MKDNGKPDRRHVQAKTEAEVIKKVRKLERERDAGTVRRPGQEWTVEKWVMHWYATIAVPNVRYKTRSYYWTAVDKYIVPGIGAHKLTRLEPEHIERFYARLRKEGAKSATLQQVHIALRASLNAAERRNRITRNPIRAVRSPKIEETEIEPLTVDDARAILRVAHDRRNGVRWGHRPRAGTAAGRGDRPQVDRPQGPVAPRLWCGGAVREEASGRLSVCPGHGNAHGPASVATADVAARLRPGQEVWSQAGR
ncbi:integrase (recombinase) [Amycolatopsis methanolica 239]|uniref:Integrase (Recombinase) n=1 Tax=Amycolatopsis methanolica 239 TaxID=1068978 RepID=A0A076N5N6_AMYME|nr:integrase (recombinase) [Amycolatopsis methanolica 239]